MKKLIPFLPLIVFILVTGCSSDSAGGESPSKTTFFSPLIETFAIHNKSDHDIVIEYFEGRRSFFTGIVREYRKETLWGKPFFAVDEYAMGMKPQYERVAWNYAYHAITYSPLKKKPIRYYPNLNPCAQFNYPFVRDRFTHKPEVDMFGPGSPVATSMRITFDKGTPGERVINYTGDGMKSRDLRRNEQWVEEDSDWPGGEYSYTFTNADYDLARTIQESALEPIPTECLQQSNYDYD